MTVAEFCEAKIGDVVYGIPRGGERPVKFFLKSGEKKMIKAVKATGEEVDFNPYEYRASSELAYLEAIKREWEFISQGIKKSFENIAEYEKGFA